MASFSRSPHMKSLPLLLGISLLSPCRVASAQNPSPAQEPIPAKSDAQLSFGAMKGLAGTWTGAVTTDPPDPDIEGPIQVTMSVASRGNVLMHEISSGGMREPTMIYVDDDRLTLVHYCDAGNRPRLVARKSSDGRTMEFDFVDVSGSTRPTYLNHFLFSIINPDRHTEDWTFTLPDGKLLHAHFDLKRAKEGPPPPSGK